MLCIFIQQNVDNIVFAVNNYGHIIRIIGIVFLDHMTITVVNNLGIQQVKNHFLFLDNQQAGISGRIVIGVGYDTIIEVITRLGVSNTVNESNVHILRQFGQLHQQLVDARIHLINVAIDLILINAHRNHFVHRDCCNQIITISSDELDQVITVNALIEPFILRQNGIQPLRQVNVDISVKGIYTNLVSIAGNIGTTGNQDVIGLQSGNCRTCFNRSGITISIINHGITSYVNRGLRQSNNQITDTCAVVTNFTVFVALNIENCNLIYTCVNRSLVRLVGLTVGLNTSVQESKFALGRVDKVAFRVIDRYIDILTCVIKCSYEVFNLYRAVVGSNNDGAGNHITNDDLAIQFKSNISNFDISTIGQICRICVNYRLVVGVYTDELIGDFCCCFIVFSSSSLVKGGCPQIKTCQQLSRKDSIFILVVPLQLNLTDLRCDHQQAGIHGRIMVRVGHCRNNNIGSNIRISNVIFEGQNHIAGHLIQNSNNTINCIGKGVEYLIACTMLLQCCGNFGKFRHQFVGQIRNGDAIDHARSVLCDQLVNPLGEVDVDSTIHRIPTVICIGAIGSDTSSNNGSIGSQTGNCGSGRNLICRIIGFVGINNYDFVLYNNCRVSRLNDQQAKINTDTYQVEQFVQFFLDLINVNVLEIVTVEINLSAVIRLKIDRVHGINTCVYRFLGTIIYCAVSLNSDVANLNLSIFAKINNVLVVVAIDYITFIICYDHAETLLFVVEFFQHFIVRLAVCSDQFYINLAGYKSKSTNQRYSIIQIISPQNTVGNLHVSTVILNIGGIQPNISLDITINVGSQEFAGISVDTQNKIFHCEIFDLVAYNTCALIHSVPSRKSSNTIVDSRIPIQSDLINSRSDNQVVSSIGSLVISIDCNCTCNVNANIGGMEVLVFNNDLDFGIVCKAGNCFNNLIKDFHRAFIQAQNVIQVIDHFGELSQSEFSLEIFTDERKFTNGFRQTQLNESYRLSQPHNILILAEIQCFGHIQTNQEFDHFRINSSAIVVLGRCNGDSEIITIAVGNILRIVVDLNSCLVDSYIQCNLTRLIVDIAREIQSNGMLTCVQVQIVGLNLKTGHNSTVCKNRCAGSCKQVIKAVAIGNVAVVSNKLSNDTIIMGGHICDSLGQNELIIGIVNADGLS